MPSAGTMEICPVCFWEDAPGEYPYNVSNKTSLPQAQLNYARMAACEQEYFELTRLPLPEEARPGGWLSFEETRKSLIGEIEAVFEDVLLDEGITLHQSVEFDCLGYPPDWLLAEAAMQDPETRWQDIPAEKISRFSGSMIHFDGKGFRFHLPAFMRYALQVASDRTWGHSDGVMFALHYGPEDGYSKKGIALLSAGQKQVISKFLQFFASSDHYHYQSNARCALKNGWAKWLPESSDTNASC